MDKSSTATPQSRGRQSVRRSSSIPIIFSLLLLITDRQQATAVPSANSCVHVGRIISVEGKVELKRQEWLSYHPASLGAALCQGDRLRSAKGARAIVQCANSDQNLWTVTASLLSSAAIGCRPPNQPINTLNAPIIPTRDPLASGVPYIISPNDTWLLNGKPVLRWQSVPGATSYIVRVAGPGVNWVREVTTTSVVYPGEPPLTSLEDDYLITVVANNGAASAKATFGLLDPQNATRVKAAVERLNQQGLTNEAKTLALAEIYLGQGLLLEATQLLESSVASGSITVAAYYLLGNIYTHLELFRQAEESYQQAVKLAKATTDIEGQAATAARLGEVYTVLGNLDKAAYWLRQAQQGYEVLLSSKPVAN